MKIRQIIGCMTIPLLLSVAAFAGPAIACHAFVTTPGSALETLEKLRRTAMQVDDSPAQKHNAVTRLGELRAAIKPGDPLSLLQAGYWAAVLESLRVVPEGDGKTLILNALAMRPNDPEYQFIAALACLPSDRIEFQKHWDEAVRLAKPASAVASNLKVFGDLVSKRTH